MSRKSSLLLGSLFLGASLLFCGSADAAGFKNLSFTGEYMPKHPTVVKVWKPFFQAAEEKFPGKNGLSFDYFSVGTLFPESEGFNALSDGRADFGVVRPPVFPGKMTLLDVVSIPGLFPNAVVGSIVTEELIQKFPEIRAQLPANSTPFTAWSSASTQIHLLKPISSMDELKGKKLIIWDASGMERVKALGANPIRMTSSDTYLALSKGMADGVLCPIAPLRSIKISEAAKYHLILNIGVSPFSMSVNNNLWNSLPEDMKAWLNAEGHNKMSLAIGKSLYEGALADTEWMKAQGHTFRYFTDEERAEALKPFAPFAEHWKKTCEGYDPKLVDAILQFARERSKYHTAQMKAGAYGDYKL